MAKGIGVTIIMAMPEHGDMEEGMQRPKRNPKRVMPMPDRKPMMSEDEMPSPPKGMHRMSKEETKVMAKPKEWWQKKKQAAGIKD